MSASRIEFRPLRAVLRRPWQLASASGALKLVAAGTASSQRWITPGPSACDDELDLPPEVRLWARFGTIGSRSSSTIPTPASDILLHQITWGNADRRATWLCFRWRRANGAGRRAGRASATQRLTRCVLPPLRLSEGDARSEAGADRTAFEAALKGIMLDGGEADRALQPRLTFSTSALHQGGRVSSPYWLPVRAPSSADRCLSDRTSRSGSHHENLALSQSRPQRPRQDDWSAAAEPRPGQPSGPNHGAERGRARRRRGSTASRRTCASTC